MESVLHLKRAIISLASKNEDFAKRCPTWIDWKLIEGAVEILKPFRETTKVWSYEEQTTFNTVTERLYAKKVYLEEFIEKKENCKYGVGFAKALKLCVEKRLPVCGTTELESCAGNFLDPRYKVIHLIQFDKLNPIGRQGGSI